MTMTMMIDVQYQNVARMGVERGIPADVDRNRLETSTRFPGLGNIFKC